MTQHGPDTNQGKIQHLNITKQQAQFLEELKNVKMVNMRKERAVNAALEKSVYGV